MREERKKQNAKFDSKIMKISALACEINKFHIEWLEYKISFPLSYSYFFPAVFYGIGNRSFVERFYDAFVLHVLHRLCSQF